MLFSISARFAVWSAAGSRLMIPANPGIVDAVVCAAYLYLGAFNNRVPSSSLGYPFGRVMGIGNLWNAALSKKRIAQPFYEPSNVSKDGHR